MENENIRGIRAELQDMERRLRHGLTPADMARLRELLRGIRQNQNHAVANVPLLRPNARLPSAAAPCNIDFTRIPELITMGVDLSDEFEPFTQEPFMPGQEYYRVTTPGNRPYYFNMDGLRDWLTSSRCRHPILQNVSIAQRDIERFTYTGLSIPIVPPIVVVGGRKFKKISKRLRQKSKRIKKSIRRRLRY
jgi:hypothetical protein